MTLHRLRLLAAVAIGGGLGATARYGLATWAGHDLSWPWVIFAVNVLGCFGVGVLMASLEHIARPHPAMRAGLGPGFLGGFTTFSTYATDVVGLIHADRMPLAAAYLIGTAVAAIGAALAGWAALGAMMQATGHEPGGAG